MGMMRYEDPILHRTSGHGGVFYVQRDGVTVAELVYTRGTRFTTIDHTRIDDALRGAGCGRRLVDEIVRWARAENVKLRPVCPFARAMLDRVPEYADVR